MAAVNAADGRIADRPASQFKSPLSAVTCPMVRAILAAIRRIRA
jgi:hypothetical protein